MAHPQTLAKFRNLLAKVNLPMSEKAMFGEVTFYCEGKVVGYCCDEFAFVKDIPVSAAFLTELVPLEPPNPPTADRTLKYQAPSPDCAFPKGEIFPGSNFQWIIGDPEAMYLSAQDLTRLFKAMLPALKPPAKRKSAAERKQAKAAKEAKVQRKLEAVAPNKEEVTDTVSIEGLFSVGLLKAN